MSQAQTAISTVYAVYSQSPLTDALHGNLSKPADCRLLNTSSWEFIPWDNPRNLLNRETEKVWDTAVGAVLLPLLFLTSVPGNLLSMLVFWRQGLKERINLCLFYLSLVDFLHMLNSFFLNVDRLKPPFTEAVGPVFEFILGHKLVGFRAFTWISGFIAMVIALERCFCVVSPLRSQTVLKTRTTAVILAVATVLILVGSMMIGLRWSVACIFDSATQTFSKLVYTGEFYTQHRVHMDRLTFFVTTLQPLTYVTVVSVATAVTSVKLKKMVSWREKTSSATLSSREVALTRTLIAVSLLYIICSVPTMMSGLCVIFIPEIGFSGPYYNFSQFVVSFFELATFINATFNFFVYCILGSRYRETLLKSFRCSGSKTALVGTQISSDGSS